MTGPRVSAGVARSAWEDAGRGAAETVDTYHAVLVIADNPTAAAYVALGVGTVQARRRRVAIGDLVGELPPLQRHAPPDLPHGLVDSFMYGVSINKIAIPIDEAKNLYIMPSGQGSIDYEAVLKSERWRKLTAGFREVDALLLLVVPPDASGIEELLALCDGALIAGFVARKPRGNIIATVTLADAQSDTDESEQPLSDPVMWTEQRRAHRKGIGIMAAAVVGVLLFIGGAVWVLGRAAAPPPAAPVPSATTPAAAPVAPEVGTPQTQAPAAASDSAAGAAVAPAPPVVLANPGDSAKAMPYAVELARINSVTGANSQLEQTAGALPAATYSPTVAPADNARWYLVRVGAFRDQRSADSLVVALRKGGTLAPDAGAVVRAPYALLVQRGVKRTGAAFEVRSYQLKGLPVYALLQSDGTVSLFAGAFETPEEAAILQASFREAGEQPPVAYRTGRAF